MTDHTTQSRREAVKTLSVATLAALGSPRRLWSAAPAVLARPGLQLYTVRTEMEKSVEATLAKVAQLGYKEVEFAGYFNRTPAQIADLLKTNGLVAPSAHIMPDALGASWDKTLDTAAAVGHQWLVVAYLPEADRGPADAYKKLAGRFNTAAAAAKARGISFAYHNHDFEFMPLGATNGHTVLMQECDPALVQFELDLYWITKAGKDAAAYVAQYPGRFPLVHVKDMTASGAMADVGMGTIDFQKIFTAAKGGIKHFYVERDDANPAFDSIGHSIEAMRRLHA